MSRKRYNRSGSFWSRDIEEVALSNRISDRVGASYRSPATSFMVSI